MPKERRARRRSEGRVRRHYLVAGLLAVVVVIGAAVWWATRAPEQSLEAGKPVILYVNQGNGAVNRTNFQAMVAFAKAQGFNTVFFQVYREGVLLFSLQDLEAFVSEAHAQNLSIFFALYFTNSSQEIPTTVLQAGEDGVSLDMSTLSLANQTSLLSTLKSEYGGKTAVTTYDMPSSLRPDILVYETYSADQRSFITKGVIGSVEVHGLTESQYQSQFSYALQNSDGVMVFDYAGLLKSGY